MSRPDGREPSPGALFVGARWRVLALSTRRLRRIERAYRRDVTGGSRVSRADLAAWAAVRAELRSRGRRLPDTDQRPGRWFG